MPNNLIKSLAPHERLFLFIALGGNGIFWVCVMAAVCWLFGWSAPVWAYMILWACVTLYALWILERLHDAKVARGDE